MAGFARAYVEPGQKRALEDPAAPVRFVASTPGVKRDGKDLQWDDWDFGRHDKHPVVLWVHDMYGSRPPLGHGVRSRDDDNLIMDVVFDAGDSFAADIRRKSLLDPPLVAGSVSWDEIERDGRIVNELTEFSIVPVPLDPDALAVRELRSWRAEIDNLLSRAGDDSDPVPMDRGAKPPHSTAKADEDTAWNGPREVAAAEGAEQLWTMHAWRDDGQDADLKQAYKLPHHLVAGEVVWNGVASAMARLVQPTTQIPDADRRGVYNHLARHYRQFDREPPEFRTIEQVSALTPDLLRGLFLEGEPELCPEAFSVIDVRHLNILQSIRDQLDQLITTIGQAAPVEKGDGDPMQLDAETVSILEQIGNTLAEAAEEPQPAEGEGNTDE